MIGISAFGVKGDAESVNASFGRKATKKEDGELGQKLKYVLLTQMQSIYFLLQFLLHSGSLAVPVACPSIRRAEAGLSPGHVGNLPQGHINRQTIARTCTDTYGQFTVPTIHSWPHMHCFGLWEEGGEPAENP